jgi:hypothetical protein
MVDADDRRRTPECPRILPNRRWDPVQTRNEVATASEDAHVIVSTVRGFKLVAQSPAELRTMVEDLTAIVALGNGETVIADAIPIAELIYPQEFGHHS